MNATLPPPNTTTYVPPAQQEQVTPPSNQRMLRPRDDRRIAGVCAAIARRFDLDVTLVRVIAVLSVFLPGPQVLAYLIGWLVLPSED